MAQTQLSTLGAVIKTAYELEANTNAYTDDEKTKLALDSSIALGAEQALSGAGAINLTSYHTKFTSAGTGDALTLADGTVGLTKKVSYVAEGDGADTGVLTLTGYTSITFNAIGDYVILKYGAAAWFIIENNGCTVV